MNKSIGNRFCRRIELDFDNYRKFCTETFIYDRRSDGKDNIDDYYFFPEVFDKFETKWKKNRLLYREFINSKELGLLANVTKENERNYGIGVHSDYYKILDEKQWFLAKIKYGI